MLIARQATGSIRDAQSLLDQLASSSTHITLDLAQPVLGTATSQAVLEMVEAIRDRQTGAGLAVLRDALDAGVDPRTLARQMVEYLRGLMLIQLGNPKQVEASNDLRERMQMHATAFTAARVIRLIRAFNAAASDLRGSWQPSLMLELALAEAMEPGAEQGVTQRGGEAAAKIAPDKVESRIDATEPTKGLRRHRPPCEHRDSRGVSHAIPRRDGRQCPAAAVCVGPRPRRRDLCLEGNPRRPQANSPGRRWFAKFVQTDRDSRR